MFFCWTMTTLAVNSVHNRLFIDYIFNIHRHKISICRILVNSSRTNIRAVARIAIFYHHTVKIRFVWRKTWTCCPIVYRMIKRNWQLISIIVFPVNRSLRVFGSKNNFEFIFSRFFAVFINNLIQAVSTFLHN
ncbi:hypothetical protein D3C80_1369820 [compost metagenome]